MALNFLLNCYNKKDLFAISYLTLYFAHHIHTENKYDWEGGKVTWEHTNVFSVNSTPLYLHNVYFLFASKPLEFFIQQENIRNGANMFLKG